MIVHPILTHKRKNELYITHQFHKYNVKMTPKLVRLLTCLSHPSHKIMYLTKHRNRIIHY